MQALICVSLLLLAVGGEALSLDNMPAFKADLRIVKGTSLRTFTSSLNGRSLKSINQAFLSRSNEPRLNMGRHMLQDSASCQWDSVDKVCEISDDAGGDLIVASRTPTARNILIGAFCGTRTSREACTSSGCLWANGECESETSAFRPETFDRCFSDVSAFFEVGDAIDRCDAISSRGSCNGADVCEWLDDDGVCDVDFLSLFFGPSFKRLSEVFDIFIDEWIAEISSNVILTRFSPPEALLEWEPPVVACPIEIDQVVCDYVEPAVERFKTALYCTTKYSDATLSGCSSDPLCEIDSDDGECTRSGAVSARVGKDQIQAALDGLESPVAAAVFGPLFTCRTETRATCKSPCAFDATDSSCSTDFAEIDKILRDVAVAEGSPECEILGESLLTGCIGGNRAACNANDQCEYSGGTCALSAKFFDDLILKADPELAADFNALNKKCGAATSQSACDRL